ncbi:MAG: outer membrane beta-barrel protein [Saprospiraceae bacterium]
MKPYIFLLFLFLSVSESVFSQEEPFRRFNAGLLLGTNASQIHGDDDHGYNKFGLLAGVTAEIRFTAKTEIGLEIVFSQLGSRSTSRSLNVLPYKSTLNYVMVPVYFKIKDWYNEEEQYYRINAFAGFSYGRLIGTPVMEGNPFQSVEGFLREDYLGFLVGALYNVNSKLGIGARWERAILDVYNNNLDNGGPPVSRGQLESLHFSFYATYFFL